MRWVAEVTLQHTQILRLPRKMTLMIDPRHIWNVIYNARSNQGCPPTSPNNTAPATKNDSHDWSSSHMKRHLQCAEKQRLPSNITKYCACHKTWLSWSSSHMKRHLQCAEQQRLPSNITKYCACHEKWLSWLILVTLHMKRHLQCAEQPRLTSNITTNNTAPATKWLSWLILVTYETSFTMRGETEVTLQHRQILRLPRKMTLMIDPRLIWNVIYNSLTNNGYPPTSSNPAPATINDSHDWSSGHMKSNAQSNRGCPPTSPNTAPATKNDSHHLQCAEQQRLYPPTSPNTAPATKNDSLMIDPRHIWNVIYNARSNRDCPPTSPNTAPATKNDSHMIDPRHTHMKRHLQCAE